MVALWFEVTGKRLSAVLEDADEGCLMPRSAIRLARECRRKKYMVDDKVKRGLVKPV